MQLLFVSETTSCDDGETILKQYTIFAGVNGAGKTSLYNSVAEKNITFGERVLTIRNGIIEEHLSVLPQWLQPIIK